MERQLDGPAAELLAPAIEALGVQVLLGASTTEVLADKRDRVMGLRFSDGEELACDLVVVAIGIRPETTLARNAGLDVERGIVVDDFMVSSHPRVLAVGECAQHRGVVHGIVAPIHEQAAVAAATVTGAEALYEGSVPSAKLKVMGVDLVSVGAAEGPRAVVSADDAAGTYRKLVIDEQTSPLVQELFRRYAGEAGLDLDRYDACMRAGKYAGRIQASYDEGVRVGVTSTPTLLVGGRLYQGRFDSDAITRLVDSLAPRTASAR